jgi:hypothetical protein
MTIKSIPMKSEKGNVPHDENQKKVEGNLEAASVHHIKAAESLKNGDYEKAAKNAILAQEYLNLASEARREDIKECDLGGDPCISDNPHK